MAGTWGKSGSANGQFLNALGITTDGGGLVYVADRDNNRLQVFTAKGGFVRKWGSQGEGSGQFTSVQNVAIGPDGSVWAADLKNGRVQQFSKDGGFETELGTPKQAIGVAVDAEGNVYASTAGDAIHAVVRFDKTPTGYSGAKTFTGAVQSPGDVEASPDGSVYVTDERTHVVRRFDAAGKPLKTIKVGPSSPAGVGVDLDCNLWVTNISPAAPRPLLAERQAARYGLRARPHRAGSWPSGQRVDLYAVHTNPSSVIRFAELKQRQAAGVPGTIAVVNGKAKVSFALPGIACPAQVAAVATLKGKGVSGKATVKVAAGRTTVITMPVKAPKGATTPATFTIVLKTNGRPTTQTKSVKVKA